MEVILMSIDTIFIFFLAGEGQSVVIKYDLTKLEIKVNTVTKKSA